MGRAGSFLLNVSCVLNTSVSYSHQEGAVLPTVPDDSECSGTCLKLLYP